MSHPARLFDDCQPGLRLQAGPRVITREDIDRFTELSGDHTRLHTDDAYAATTPFGRVVAHGALNLAVATGLAWATGAFEGSVLAFVSLTVRYERPVFPGDSVMLHLAVKEQDGRPRPDRGRVTFEVELRNQQDKVVLSGDWTLLLRRDPAGPAAAGPPAAANRPH
jgi:acyl dehydratase